MRPLSRSTGQIVPGLPIPSLAFSLLCMLFAVLWLAGGASRGDVLGQVVVRVAAFAALVVLALFGRRPVIGSARPVAWLIGAALALPLLQLIPLPPGWWVMLPGRDAFTAADVIAGGAMPWRPLAIVPGLARNAAFSLVVPIATFVLVIACTSAERARLLGLLLVVITTAVLLGLLQFSGAVFNNPFINETTGTVSAIFANRNHFALLLAIGCVLAPVWAFGKGSNAVRSGQRNARRGTGINWRVPLAGGLLLLLLLLLVATGSRAGLLAGAMAAGLATLIVWHDARAVLARGPRWLRLAFVIGVIVIVVFLVLVSVMADRAAAIDRIFALDPGTDMRHRGLPTVLTMTAAYFPAGTGLGSFDPLFRMHEPFGLLKPTFFNHAHNDWLEIVMDGGLAGVALLAAAVFWWGRVSLHAWRHADDAMPRLGSAVLLLVMVASAFDYPARTPTMMAVIVIAALWLSDADRRDAPRDPSALTS